MLGKVVFCSSSFMMVLFENGNYLRDYTWSYVDPDNVERNPRIGEIVKVEDLGLNRFRIVPEKTVSNLEIEESTFFYKIQIGSRNEWVFHESEHCCFPSKIGTVFRSKEKAEEATVDFRNKASFHAFENALSYLKESLEVVEVTIEPKIPGRSIVSLPKDPVLADLLETHGYLDAAEKLRED